MNKYYTLSYRNTFWSAYLYDLWDDVPVVLAVSTGKKSEVESEVEEWKKKFPGLKEKLTHD